MFFSVREISNTWDQYFRTELDEEGKREKEGISAIELQLHEEMRIEDITLKALQNSAEENEE